jgi:DNA invertase Pin-like site-specific DNA recombinase
MQIGYARCSTSFQDHSLQLDALRDAGCERIFVETASGSKTDRVELAQALDLAREGDQICVWRLDRLARSLKHLIELSEELSGRGVALRSLTENIDTSSASGRFLFNVFSSIGQMEVDILRERVKAGLQASRARNRVGGRPPALDDAKIRAAKAMLASGTMSAAEVAKQLGCAPSTLYRHLPGGRGAVLSEQVAAAA